MKSSGNKAEPMTLMQDTHDPSRRQGFTLTEVMIASSILVLVGVAVMSLFIWCSSQSSLFAKIAWSQNEAMRTSGKLIAYMQNASTISKIDTNHGWWVELKFPDGRLGRLTFTNTVGTLRQGQLILKWSNSTERIVARGLTEIMDDGFTTPMFEAVRSNVIAVSYRVSEPVAAGVQAADDADFAAICQFSVCLRNCPQ
jgi:prepilin-type N-terminal cleavage/methylation domain-containing protein